MRKEVVNVPNALSTYRIVALPFIIYSIATHNKTLYIALISINLITDILDGYIARKFKLETELGAKLDSVADVGTYLMAFAGMIILEKDFVTEHKIAFLFLIGLWILPQIISLIKFRRFPSFHLYSNKATGYVQGIFIFTYFLFGYNAVYFYFMIFFSYLAYLEELVIVLFIPRLRSNLRSIYFLLKEQGGIR